MLIAIPSDTTDGLDATTSDHFGHCAAFTLVTIRDGAIGEGPPARSVQSRHLAALPARSDGASVRRYLFVMLGLRSDSDRRLAV